MIMSKNERICFSGKVFFLMWAYIHHIHSMTSQYCLIRQIFKNRGFLKNYGR